MTKDGQYVQLVWSYPLGNIGSTLRVPLDASSTPVTRVEFVNLSITTQPVSVATHTAYVIHWNQNDIMVPKADGSVNLTNTFLYTPIIYTTWESSSMFDWAHHIDEACQMLEFNITYEDNSTVVLTAADARFSINMLLYLTN
jgi:hypothetical protein